MAASSRAPREPAPGRSNRINKPAAQRLSDDAPIGPERWSFTPSTRALGPRRREILIRRRFQP